MARGRSPHDPVAEVSGVGSCGRSCSGHRGPDPRSEADTSCRFAKRPGTSTYPPTAKCRCVNAARTIHSFNAGNAPQRKRFAKTMADEEMRAVLVVGGEAQSTQPSERAKLPVSWSEGPGGRPEIVGDPLEQDEECTADRALRSRSSLRLCQRCAPPTARSRPAATRSGTAKTVPTRPRSSVGVPKGAVVSFANGFCGSADRDCVSPLVRVKVHNDRNLFVPD